MRPRFMTHWDGLASSSAAGSNTPQRICILGATNRIQDIDEAILRRMPKKFPVALPSATQRHNIFSLILRGTKIDHQNFDLNYLVRVSAGMSGSDIKEACRDAAMGPVREYIRRKKADGTLRSSKGMAQGDVRGLRTEDFFGRGKGLREMETVDDVERPKRIAFNCGSQAKFFRTGPLVPGNIVKLAFENFGREWRVIPFFNTLNDYLDFVVFINPRF